MRRPSLVLATALLQLLQSQLASATPTVVDSRLGVTYNGIDRNGVEVYEGIRYGQDTSGQYRFQPPRPFAYAKGTTVSAQALGPACPQDVNLNKQPLILGKIAHISEDCLNLVVVRPNATVISAAGAAGGLPVMVWIHGGSLFVGYNGEPTTRGDGLVLESIENGMPVIHVAINYRLGVFGFAQSAALRNQKSENAGLRDQRLAIEWVRDNIKAFGGNPNSITIHGQSSGGLSVTAQILAFGGAQGAPFQRAIIQSEALDNGLTGTYTRDSMQRLVDYIGCNQTTIDDAATIACLRKADMLTLFNASKETYHEEINAGDIWQPSIDGDFWPEEPSEMLKNGSFTRIEAAILGWTQDDMSLFADPSIQTADDSRASIVANYPWMSSDNVDTLLSLYDVRLFPANPAANKSAEFYRVARILRDVLMVCQPWMVGSSIAAYGGDVYYYDWNQTILTPVLTAGGAPGSGIVHSSEFAYIFGNLSAYNVDGFPFEPTDSDYALQHRGSRSWSTFATTGKPYAQGHDTFLGWEEAYPAHINADPFLWVAGGTREGWSASHEELAFPEIEMQDLRGRCGFINSPGVVRELKYRK